MGEIVYLSREDFRTNRSPRWTFLQKRETLIGGYFTSGRRAAGNDDGLKFYAKYNTTLIRTAKYQQYDVTRVSQFEMYGALSGNNHFESEASPVVIEGIAITTFL